MSVHNPKENIEIVQGEDINFRTFDSKQSITQQIIKTRSVSYNRHQHGPALLGKRHKFKNTASLI